MREIDVPGMRRNVRALRHVADVAKVALVDDLPVVVLGDAIDFHRRAVVDEVEKRGEGVAQAHAPPAAMTDVEDAVQLGVERPVLVELRIAPVARMTRGAERAVDVSPPGRRAPSGTGWRASAPLWRASRTNPRSRRTLPRAPPSP